MLANVLSPRSLICLKNELLVCENCCFGLADRLFAPKIGMSINIDLAALQLCKNDFGKLISSTFSSFFCLLFEVWGILTHPTKFPEDTTKVLKQTYKIFWSNLQNSNVCVFSYFLRTRQNFWRTRQNFWRTLQNFQRTLQKFWSNTTKVM